MPRLPVVSGRTLISFMRSIGYAVVRQRGSHVRLEMVNVRGRWVETVPDHTEVAKGTLRGIIRRMADATDRSEDDLISALSEY